MGESVTVAIDRPANCEDCGEPMILELEIREDDYSRPGETLVYAWPEWICEACEMAYSFEYEDLEPEDLALLDSEETRLLDAYFKKLETEAADWKRLDAIARRKADRAARLARRKR